MGDLLATWFSRTTVVVKRGHKARPRACCAPQPFFRRDFTYADMLMHNTVVRALRGEKQHESMPCICRVTL